VRRGLGTTPWWQFAALLLLAAVTATLCYLALSRDTTVSDGFAAQEKAGSESSAGGSASGEPSEEPAEESTPQADPPKVPNQRLADFIEGDDLPDGARDYSSDASSSGIRVTPDGLTHGEPTGPGAVGLIETELKSDVRALGFRVAFADSDSGSVALIGSQTSLVDALSAGEAAAPTGLRLVASPREWELVVDDGDGEDVIGSGTFERPTGPATFKVVREGASVWVVDPDGTSTQVADPRVEALAGSWASWALIEDGPQQKPAVIEAVWGG
jgi:hypothetical protein